MVAVDNFGYFKKHLPFQEGVCFLVYLHRRKKENDDMVSDTIDNGDENVLKGWWLIHDAKELDSLRDEMIAGVREHNARLYVKPTPVHPEDLKEKTFSQALLTQRQSENLYIIDCDRQDIPHLDDIKSLIEDSFPKYKKIVYEVPSVHGVHLITKPFLLQEFKRKYPIIHFGVSRGTVLYYENKTN